MLLQLIDVVVGVVVVVVQAHAAAEFQPGPFPGLTQTQPTLEILIPAVGAGVAIAVRRRVPMTALALMALCIAVGAGTGMSTVLDPFIAIPMYQVAATYERRRSLPALFAVVALLVSASTVRSFALHRADLEMLGLVVGIAAWFVGDSVRVRRTYVAGLAEQAAQRQRESEERAQRSVAEERLQIARELHDVVAHSLSVIAVQSGVGRHVIDSQPAEAKKALAAVEATSRSALDELRRMLGVLRRDDGQPAALAPAPGVDALDPLMQQVRMAGYVVDLDIRSTAVGALAPGVEQSIYRIIQEALTNVVKHAGPARVRVEILDVDDALVIEVNDDGRGLSRPLTEMPDVEDGAHHGIVGMRERVALYDGILSVGPRPEGGFRVYARFQLDTLAAS
jgi:signal transduction histidine kinase